MALVGMAACADSAQQRLVLGATHTVEDSGLLEVLEDAFHDDSEGDRLSIVVAGSGEILAMAARGDVDVVLSHSPDAERRLVADGAFGERIPVMANDFLIAGPAADPADVRSAGAAAEAFEKIARTAQPFVSRGDDSGTHRAERALWLAAGLDPSWPGYVEVGSGMAEGLRLAAQRGAYVFTDRATFEALRHVLAIDALYDRPDELPNTYSILVSTRARNGAGAQRFATWMTGARARGIIAGYQVRGRNVYDVPVPR